ncbi:hypothetical protein [Ferrimonas pelagia]|uniref:Uncharacterized protein n=1 Tax=Ferrimonas pelagia TaxID=1177826 RepID=A0ABP9FKG9_9GAMM
MKQRLFVSLWLTVLIGHVQAAPVEAPLQSVAGYWIYGFEQSQLHTCDGRQYWMWTPLAFKGRYQLEGFANPVRTMGRLAPPDPDNNMNTILPTWQVSSIEHAQSPCGETRIGPPAPTEPTR